MSADGFETTQDKGEKGKGKDASRLKGNVDDSYLIDHKELQFKQDDLIGEGNFGAVYRGSLYGIEVAIKKFHQQNLEKETLDDLVNEIKILSKLHHPNVLLLIGVCAEQGNLAIVTELMVGNLFSLLHSQSSQPPPLRKRLKYAADACLGMAYLHRPNNTILHRDLKALNLLVDKNGTLKVADFGISQMNKSREGDPYLGSTAWVSPEVFQGKEYTAKCDVYSFAVVLWEILTCEIPWKGLNGAIIVNKVGKKQERPEIPQSCAPRLKSLIQSCWNAVPEERPAFSAILPEIRLCIIEASVFDPVGRNFWSTAFPDSEEVAFDVFQQHFAKSLRVKVLSDVAVECLRMMMCATECLVTLDSFNKCLSFFGPLEAKGGQAFVDRIVNMCEKPFFHGDIEKDEAVKLLSRQKKGGSYLVRFSGTSSQQQEALGNYALSLKKKNGGVAHIRLTGGGGTVCDNLEKFIKLNKKEIGLKHACPGSRYEHIFKREEKDEVGLTGYEFTSPVDMSGPLKVDKKK
jgi:serine/threonine protein kinase